MSYMFYSSGDAPNGYDMYTGNSPLLDILDLCLVYGYSNHPPLGWTIEDRSETHRVYRAPAGSQRKFLRVANVVDAVGTIHSVNVYDSIAPETNRWFTPDLPSSLSSFANNWPCIKQASNAPPWILFGDSQFFTLIVSSTSQSSPADSGLHFLFFGEVNGATYLNLNPNFSAGPSGTLTRAIRNASNISSGSASLYTNLDNPNILSPINGQQVVTPNNAVNFDSSRDTQRTCWPCGFSQTITEAAQSSTTQFGVRSLNDMRLSYDGILPYGKLYFVTRNNFLNDRLGMQILAAHPHILIAGCSPAETTLADAAMSQTVRLADGNKPLVNIDGVQYIPFIIGNSSSADNPFILIRAS